MSERGLLVEIRNDGLVAGAALLLMLYWPLARRGLTLRLGGTRAEDSLRRKTET